MTDSKRAPDSSRRYAVFLSYRHADNKEPGRQWATWLHHLLEGYEIPADLVGKENNRGGVIPPSLYPVFRDEEELPADADLTRNIRQALENSDLLVVLCSPRAVESRFVADEIRYFKTLGRSDRVLALMIDGEPNASDDPGKAQSGIPPEAECLPEPLRFGVAAEIGTIDWSQRTEPIAADVRPEGKPEQGWTTGAAYREALQKEVRYSDKEIAHKVAEYEQRLELAKLKVVAGSLGVPLGELTRRDKAMQLERARKRARILRRWLLAVGVLTTCAISAGIFALLKARAEREQRLLAQEATAKVQQAEGVIQKDAISAHESASAADFSLAESRIKEGDPSGALPYLADALRQNPKNQDATALTVSLLKVDPHIQTQLSHNAPVSSASISQDNRVALTYSGGKWQFWDIQSQAPIHSAAITGAAVHMVRFAPEAKNLFVVEKQEGATWSAQYWDLRTGKAAGPAVQSSDQSAARIVTPDGRQALIVSRKGEQVWDLKTGKLVRELHWNLPLAEHPELLEDFLSPNGNRLVLFGGSGAQVYDLVTGKQVGPAMMMADSIHQVQISADGKRLLIVYGGDNDNVSIWDLDAGKQLGDEITYSDLIHHAAFSPSGDQVVTLFGGPYERGAVSEKVQAQVWDARTGQAIGKPLTHYGNINSVEFSPNGRWILTASDDKTAQIWDARTGEPVGYPMRHAAKVNSARFSSDGEWVVTASDDNTARIWMAQTEYGFDEAAYYPKTWQLADFSPDGQSMVTAWPDKTARVWALTTGKVVAHSPVFSNPVFSAEFNAGGNQVFILTAGKEPQTVGANPMEAQIWDAQMERRIRGPKPNISSARFSPDGKLIVAVFVDGTVGIWDVATGKSASPLFRSSPQVLDAILSKDGRWLVARCGLGSSYISGPLYIWDLQSPQHAPKRIGDQVSSVEFSPDGKLILTVSDSQVARLWDLSSGQPVASPALSGDSIDAAAFTPDGLGILTVTGSVAQIRDLQSGKPLTDPMEHKNMVRRAAFAGDGRWVMTVQIDGKVQIWDAQTGKAVSLPFGSIGCTNFFWSFHPNAQWAYGKCYGNSTGRLWDGMINAPEAPPWLADLAETVSGLEVSPKGTLEISQHDPRAMIQVLKNLTGSDDLSRFGRWFVADPGWRTISPRSFISIPEFVAESLRPDTADELNAAYLLDPGNPLLLASIAKFETDKDEALYLCRHALDRARIESSPQTIAQVLAIARSIFPKSAEFSDPGGASSGHKP